MVFNFFGQNKINILGFRLWKMNFNGPVPFNRGKSVGKVSTMCQIYYGIYITYLCVDCVIRHMCELFIDRNNEKMCVYTFELVWSDCVYTDDYVVNTRCKNGHSLIHLYCALCQNHITLVILYQIILLTIIMGIDVQPNKICHNLKRLWSAFVIV